MDSGGRRTRAGIAVSQSCQEHRLLPGLYSVISVENYKIIYKYRPFLQEKDPPK